MGLTASLMCRCYVEGKAKPCPFPEWFEYDPSTMPALHAEFEDPDEAEEVFESFQAWLETACEHPKMEYAREFIAGWSSFRQFIAALKELGEAHFPTLIDQLYDGGEGVTPVELVPTMLEELERFEARQSELLQAVLVDAERDEIVSMGSDTVGGVLVLDRVTGYSLGFDKQGFFVLDRYEMNRQYFRARVVEQRLLHPETQEVEFVDQETGRSFRCRAAFGKQVTGEDGIPRMYLAQFQVELRPILPERYVHITAPLRRILHMAQQVGNPIRWL